MSFSISGYVLEPIRVGQANSPFTQTPDNLISDQGSFDAAYPSSEDAPRTDYMVYVTSEGVPRPGLLEFSRFGWTKNEVIQRFGYASQQGSFKPLPGSSPIEVGNLSATSNTTRLKVRPPVQAAVVTDAPYRLAIGGAGSGTAWTVTIVANETGFGSPASGTAELALDTGALNWNSSDLVTYSGQRVRFQQQQFFDYKDSTGHLGTAPILLADPVLILNPLPGPGQVPLLRFGYGFYQTVLEVGSFSPVVTLGTIEWLSTTGELKFNPIDALNHAGVPVYYDGVLFATNLSLPSQPLGVVSVSPGAISGLPTSGVDLLFTLPNASPYYRFPRFSYVTTFSSGQSGVVQVNPITGDVRFSDADVSKYGGQLVMLFFGDLLIERGVSVRLLRTPVNLDAALPTVKDVAEVYSVEGATWSDPIIQFPQVSLPSIPIDDPGYPLTVRILQGQGNFVSDNFPQLDVPVPPVGLGYYIDYDLATLFFAQRKDQQIVAMPQATSDVVLPDPLVLTGNLTVEIETAPGSGIYTPLVIGSDAVIEPLSGVVTLTATNDSVAQGTAAITGTLLFDPTAQFLVDGITPGYVVVIPSSAAQGVYRVAAPLGFDSLQLDVASPTPVSSTPYTIFESSEILADRYFSEVVLLDPSTSVSRTRFLGVSSNSPRLNVPVAYLDRSSFLVGSSSGALLTIVQVPDDASFTSPPAGTVQLSQETGNLNFALADLGVTIFWTRVLIPNVDYVIQAGLGLVQLKDRMLTGEEASVTYTVAPPSTTPPTPPGSPITEAARFLIRKEITQDHPVPTSTLSFNLAGLPVTSDPPPAVFRGGRPQKLGVQCTVDIGSFTITFLADSQITDALPHGATISPNERVYIDYYVTQAVGGENTFTVLQPPMLSVAVNISDSDEGGNPNNKFVVYGDQTAQFPADSLLRIETEQVYLIGSSVWDSGTNQTTVTLAGSQVFQDSFLTPKVYVSSGPTPISTYFAPELATYEPVARGSNTFLVAGDKTVSYRPGTVLLFQDSGPTFTDFLSVSGAEYDPDSNRTKVMLSSNVPRQYVPSDQFLNYSVRPVFEPPTVEVSTSKVPVLSQPYIVYRRVAGTVGEILTPLVDFTIDDTGRIVFSTPLGPNEEFGILYTGRDVVQAGLSLRASYTSQVTPSAINGLLGQTLLADYSIKSPDTFYYRVETMTNFRGEYAVEIASAASSGSSGPQTSNTSQPELFEQGRKSLYFDEKHLANQDIIARSSLLFYNDLTNLLEQYRRYVDGTVVGNNDGRLLFDGTTGATHPPGPVSNQIDDTIKVSNAPYSITFPPFTVTSIGTFKKYYIPGPLSRFYPTAKNFFGVAAVTPSSVSGDEVVDTRSTNVTLVSNLHTRLAWGVVTESTQFSGPNTLKVDFALGTEPGFVSQAEAYARPAFKNGMKCVVQARDGSFINPVSSPVTITGVSANQLTISGGLGGTVNVGDTVYRSPSDDSVQVDPDKLTNYVAGRDYSFHGEPGQITYIEPNGVAPPGDNTPLVANQALSGQITLSNQLTSPLKFPALYGGIEDDDGDLSFPIQSPDPVSEQDGYLFTEKQIIDPSAGLIRNATTTAPILSTGSVLDVPKVVITDPAIGTGAMNPNQPQQHDLVRILTGLNGGSAFRRIASVGVGSLTVDSAFAVNDSGFSYELAVSPTLATGTADPPFVTYQLTDATASFLATAQIGQTVVFTSAIAGQTGLRRQIYEINSNTTLSFFPSLSVVVPVGATYRIENSLATYRDTFQGADYATLLEATLNSELTLYPNEKQALLDAVDLVFTDVTTGTAGQVSAFGATFTDLAASFLDAGVLANHFVYIETGANAGIYKVQSVDSQTQLTVTSSFASNESGISYRVASLFGLSEDSVTAIFTLAQSIDALLSPISTLLVQLAVAPVIRLGLADPDTFACGLLGSDLDTRNTQLTLRQNDLVTIVPMIEAILASTDQVYDKRYVWIDTRINLENGLVVQQATAVTNRIKAQANNYNQLLKLLAVEGS